MIRLQSSGLALPLEAPTSGSIWQFDKDTGAGLDRSAELVEKAIALDDSEASAYAVRGWIEGIKSQHDRAVADGKRAALNIARQLEVIHA